MSEEQVTGEITVEPAPPQAVDSPVIASTVQPTKHSAVYLVTLRLLQLTSAVLLVFAVAVVSILGYQRLMNKNPGSASQAATADLEEIVSAAVPQGEAAKPTELVSRLEPITAQDAGHSLELGIPRFTLLHTTIPTRPRVDVITYTVQQGDTLFVIADNYGIKPETLLWGNFDVLEDNPHVLKPGQVLNILPVNGTYYQWSEGDDLASVAKFFDADAETILDYPGNRFDLASASLDNPGLKPGDWLIVPDGRREIKDWGPPAISRTNPAAARYYGPGFCGSIYEGAIGNGTFVWPTVARTISGYNYVPGVHPAIDIAGAEGNAIFATDGGVVVYSGWSNSGYGYLVVVDHGTGWQSAYAHMSAINVTCGQSVFQGSVIGAVGNTGNSYGSHLHFELVYNGAKLNPLDFLQ